MMAKQKPNIMNLLDEKDDNEAKEKKVSGRGVIPALLFKARTDIHLTHLRQKDKTFATHNALNIFYDEILDLIDAYVETSMGVDETFILEEVEESEIIANPLQYFKDLYETIQVERASIKESFIQNQIDEMTQLIAHTMYRLRNIIT